MNRVSLFLEEVQIRKAKDLGRRIDAPWASVVRQALDFYFEALKQEGITPDSMPELLDGRVSRSKLNRAQPHSEEKVASPKPRNPKLQRWILKGKLISEE